MADAGQWRSVPLFPMPWKDIPDDLVGVFPLDDGSVVLGFQPYLPNVNIDCCGSPSLTGACKGYCSCWTSWACALVAMVPCFCCMPCATKSAMSGERYDHVIVPKDGREVQHVQTFRPVCCCTKGPRVRTLDLKSAQYSPGQVGSTPETTIAPKLSLVTKQNDLLEAVFLWHPKKASHAYAGKVAQDAAAAVQARLNGGGQVQDPVLPSRFQWTAPDMPDRRFAVSGWINATGDPICSPADGEPEGVVVRSPEQTPAKNGILPYCGGVLCPICLPCCICVADNHWFETLQAWRFSKQAGRMELEMWEAPRHSKCNCCRRLAPWAPRTRRGFQVAQIEAANGGVLVTTAQHATFEVRGMKEGDVHMIDKMVQDCNAALRIQADAAGRSDAPKQETMDALPSAISTASGQHDNSKSGSKQGVLTRVGSSILSSASSKLVAPGLGSNSGQSSKVAPTPEPASVGASSQQND